MKRKKSSRNIIKKRKRRTTDAKPSSPYHVALRSLRILDRNIFVFFILIIAFLYFGNHINLNMKTDWPVQFQIQRLNPDARLYYSLANNIVDGTGYHDTYRNKKIMPSVGHPLLLAICCVIGGLSPAQFSWVFLFVSFVFLGLGVRIYTKSNVCVLLALWLYGTFFGYIRWLSGNVEASIVLSNTVLIFSLAYLYRSNFKVASAVIGGIALAVNLLIRPIYLFPMHACFIVLLGLIIYHYIRKREESLSNFVKGWLILLITAEAIMISAYFYSRIKYKDSRLVTGTYGGIILYAGNNIHLPPDEVYNTKKKYPEEFYKIVDTAKGDPTVTWRERQNIIMREVKNYWEEYPFRALRGWWWRFRLFLGVYSGNLPLSKPLIVLHGLSVAILFFLTLVRIIFAWKLAGENKILLTNSLGLTVTVLFLLYSLILSVFAYSEFRRFAPLIPLLVAADIVLLFEVRKLFNRAVSVFNGGKREMKNRA